MFLLLLLGIALVEPFEMTPSRGRMLAWLTGTVAAVAFVGITVASAVLGRREFWPAVEFELTESEIIERKPEWAPVAIPLAAITAIHELKGWLVVKGNDKTISVPAGVNHFEELRRELTRYQAVTAPAKRSPLASLAALLVMLGGFAGLVLAREAWLITLCGAVVLILFLTDSRRSLRQLAGAPKVWLVKLYLVIVAVTILFIIYFRLRAAL